MFIGWQALVIAAIASPVAQLVKKILDVTMTKERRKGNKWISKVALPMVPIVIGAVAAAFIPVRPEALIEYVGEHAKDGWQQLLAYGAWGAACGQFADYLYSKLKDFVTHGKA
jgi:hypothetical protein